MTDIKLVIKIDEEIYKNIIENGFIYDEDNEYVTQSIKKSTPLPKKTRTACRYRRSNKVY